MLVVEIVAHSSRRYRMMTLCCNSIFNDIRRFRVRKTPPTLTSTSSKTAATVSTVVTDYSTATVTVTIFTNTV